MNDDLPLFSQNWRHTDPVTSKEAGEKAFEFAHHHHALILNAMKRAKRPVAAEEIGDLLGWEIYHPIGRRLHELVAAGLIERTEERHVNRSGRGAFRYRLLLAGYGS